jgi:hypothetical protein
MRKQEYLITIIIIKRLLAEKPVFAVALDVVPEQPVDPLDLGRVGLGRNHPDLRCVVQRLNLNSGKRGSHLDTRLGRKATRFAAEFTGFRRPARKPIFKIERIFSFIIYFNKKLVKLQLN